MEKIIDNLQDDFERFMKKREKASLAFVNGDAALLEKLSTHASPATIFGPSGDCVQGAEQVISANAKGSKNFKSGSENKFEVMHAGAADGFAYWTGIQHSVVQMEGKPTALPMDLRVTEIFRNEGGEWKLIHRHADPLQKSDGN
jgi:ketosteroid isomerase-like protein